MTTSGDQIHLRPPPVQGDHHSDETGIFSKSERPNMPPPAPEPENTPSSASKPPPNGHPNPSPPVQHRFLTPTEWARVAHGIGAIREGETHQVVHPTCWYWPPKGLPDGLYRDVVTQRTKYCISYQLLSTLRWALMVLQITVGATLTALGSVQLRTNRPITALAIVNTIDAGLLALLHNSGLPDRYRLDKAEFDKIEDFIKEVLDTGIVEAQQTVDDVLNECYARFQQVKATVMANKPDAYVGSSAAGRDKAIICPEPVVHVPGRT